MVSFALKEMPHDAVWIVVTIPTVEHEQHVRSFQYKKDDGDGSDKGSVQGKL